MSRPSPLVPAVVGVALLLSVAIAFFSLLVTVTAQSAESLPDDATLLRMKVKDLKAYLEKKGPDAACLACTTKQEYVSRIRETSDWPDITPPPEPSPVADEPSLEDLQKMFTEGQNDERIIELKKKLQEAGIDTSKMFTTTGINRDEILKEKETWEKMRDEVSEDDADRVADADEEEGGQDDSDGADAEEPKSDL